MEYFELNKLAPKTYEKVMAETKDIREKISDAFGRFVPHDKEVKVFYKGMFYILQKLFEEISGIHLPDEIFFSPLPCIAYIPR